MRRGAFWLMVSQMTSRGLEFVFGVILARLLVPEDFGLLVTVQVFTGVAGFFAAGGMGQALVRRKRVADSDFQTVFTVQLLIGSLIYSLFFLISPWFADWFGRPVYRDLLRVSTLTFLVRPFLSIPKVRLQREMRFRATGLVQSAGLVVTGLSSTALALHGFGVWSLVLGSLVGTLSAVVPLCLAARWVPRIRLDLRAVRELGSYGFKATANDLLDYLKMQTPNFLISRLQGPGMVGLFNKADSLQAIPVQWVSGSLYQPLFRGLSENQDNPDRSKYLYMRALTLAAAYGLPFYVGLWWLADAFVLVVYGERWRAAAEPLRILATAGLLNIVGNQSGALVAAQDRLGREMLIQFQTVLLLAAAVLWGMPRGLAGMAEGVVGANLFICLRMAHLAAGCVNAGFRDFARALWPPVLLNALLFGVLYAADLAWRRWGPDDPAAYLLAMGAVGGTGYSLLFLACPLKALASEAERWKRRLGIPDRWNGGVAGRGASRPLN
jgi:teichuronic acid exporter